MKGQAVVVGVGESSYYKRGDSPDSEFKLCITAIRNAAADAGLELADIDGFVSYMDTRNDPLRLAHSLGCRELRWAGSTWAGGGNNAAGAVQLADAAVSAGYAKNVVVFRALAQGQFGRFGQSYAGETGAMSGDMAWKAPYGLLSPAQECALHTARFMKDHGITQEALCDISMACFANAQRNPRAVRYGQPLTREKYHNSRYIAEPFHLYDCCPENDGAAAIVVTSKERGEDLHGQSVPILAAAQGVGPKFGFSAFQPGNLGTMFYRNVGEALWQRAGVRPTDMDVIQMYENFTGPVLIALCEMGFCEPDEVEAFVANDALVGPDARTPFNTAGGNIGEAYIHGFELIVEAVRQVRGDSTCQVKDVNYSLAVAGPGYAPGSAVLFSAH
ncbi:MAG: acetyl-CoA acetyltransferase [Gammaproteobacteria bacterium]|nr:acetyl-CoA acetyltransferase [Gammaproteobacteria bacterium]NNM12408.1 acetyl-CoA acetyltransferase [Pseudomonadales bacterium]RZV56076.1 MAG: acetyl-CoA acetyltransferase [Pseudomonadales bacterium]